MQNVERVSETVVNGNSKKTKKTKSSITEFFTYINRDKPSIASITRKYRFEEIQLKGKTITNDKETEINI